MASPPPTERSALLRAALAIRDRVDAGAGSVTESADVVFQAFGFVPSSYAEQQQIEQALEDVGMAVKPAADGQTIVLVLRDEPPAPAATPPRATWAAPEPGHRDEERPPAGASGRPAVGEVVARPAPPRSQPARQPHEAASTDVVQTVTKLDRAIKARRDTDVTLIHWWLYILLVWWVTLGIYGLYLYFKRITRIDRFSERKRASYEAAVEWTERRAEASGRGDAVRHELSDLRSDVGRAYQGDLKPINAGLSFVLTLVTLGLYGFFVLYRMNRYWWDAQVLEQDFDDRLSQAWIKLGIVRYPITFEVDQSKRRSYPLYLVLTFVTIGIWGLVWDYKIHTDPENLYGSFHSVEDTILQTVRAG